MIGERLKKLRKERRLTQGQLGKGILSVSYISQIENNNLPIPEYLIEEIAKRLNITVDQLVGINEEKKIMQIRNMIDRVLGAIYHLQYDKAQELMGILSKEITEIYEHEELQIEYVLLQMMYALLQNDLIEAEQKINLAKDLPIAKYPHLFYRFLRIVGMYKYLNGLYVESLEYYRQAFNMEEETKKITLDSAYLVYDMALAYWHLNNLQRTYYYNQIAHSRFTELGNWFGLCESLMIFGVIYYFQNAFEKSLEQYNKALKLAEDISEKHLQATILHNIGLVYEKLNRLEEAHTHWQKALTIFGELQDQKNISFTLLSVTESFLKQKEYDQFILHMNLLTANLKECDEPFVEGKSLQLMGDYYRDKGDMSLFKTCYSNAIDCFAKGNQVLDSAELTFLLAQELDDSILFKKAAELYHKYHTQLSKL